jgi:hypothetical protein
VFEGEASLADSPRDGIKHGHAHISPDIDETNISIGQHDVGR